MQKGPICILIQYHLEPVSFHRYHHTTTVFQEF